MSPTNIGKLFQFQTSELVATGRGASSSTWNMLHLLVLGSMKSKSFSIQNTKNLFMRDK